MGFREVDESARASVFVSGERKVVPLGVLLHTTEGTSSLGWLLGGSADAGTPASADYLIDRDGTRHKLSRPSRYAYHAGKGRVFLRNKLYQGDQVSQVLVGIEIERNAEQDITREQYMSLAEVIHNLALTYDWPGDYAIVGHYATARPRGRRSDPCNFDWGVLRALLHDPSVQLPLPHIGE